MRLIRIKEVSALTSLARATIYKYMQEGNFPKQVSLGANAVAWVEAEIEEWIASKVLQRDANS